MSWKRTSIKESLSKIITIKNLKWLFIILISIKLISYLFSAYIFVQYYDTVKDVEPETVIEEIVEIETETETETEEVVEPETIIVEVPRRTNIKSGWTMDDEVTSDMMTIAEYFSNMEFTDFEIQKIVLDRSDEGLVVPEVIVESDRDTYYKVFVDDHSYDTIVVNGSVKKELSSEGEEGEYDE
jgi:hypothetical protein